MKLCAVGHLTHGYKINFSGKAHTGINYGVSKKDEYLDYDEILKIANESKATHKTLKGPHGGAILCAEELKKKLILRTGGTDNYSITVNVININGLNVKDAVDILEKINIAAKRNGVPFDPLPPATTNGVRVGSSAMTTRDFKEEQFTEIRKVIISALKLSNRINDDDLNELTNNVEMLLKRLSTYEDIKLPQ
uniref:Serine hydroxymethyltransferase n=1 Tax=Eufriesea mexicana TaxID=516756 RepID=A0A310SHL5_9HYME